MGKMHQRGPGGFVPTNADLVDVLDDTHFGFGNVFFFLIFGIQFSGFLGFQIPSFLLESDLGRGPFLRMMSQPTWAPLQWPDAVPKITKTTTKLDDPKTLFSRGSRQSHGG